MFLGAHPMGDDRAFAQGLKLAAIAVVSAVLTATLIIGAGEAMMRRSAAMAPEIPAASNP